MRSYPGPERLRPWRSANRLALRGQCNTTRDQVAPTQSRVLARDPMIRLRCRIALLFCMLSSSQGFASRRAPSYLGEVHLPKSVASSKSTSDASNCPSCEGNRSVGREQASRGCWSTRVETVRGRSEPRLVVSRTPHGHPPDPHDVGTRRTCDRWVFRSTRSAVQRTLRCADCLGNPPREERDPGGDRGAFSPSR
jgi:hypothetical protein